jgi:hypothetical protein
MTHFTITDLIILAATLLVLPTAVFLTAILGCKIAIRRGIRANHFRSIR